MCKFNWHIFSKLIMDCREKFLKCPKPLAIAATGLCWPIRSNRWSRRRTPSTKFYSGRFHPEIQSLWCPFREPLWEKALCSDGSRPWAKVGGKGGGSGGDFVLVTPPAFFPSVISSSLLIIRWGPWRDLQYVNWTTKLGSLAIVLN